ncbi:Dimer-Tnp-hAT domain containing protein [Pyrenophora tritici-repentis]|nr:Dimer-Tnp-hAT domain containing protein [Pyrenophora tritici-repentis]
MRSNGLTADDWQVVTEYMDVLSPLKECTKRLEGRGKAKDEDEDEAINDSKPGSFGAIAEIIPVFEYLLTTLESRLQSYDDVVHDAHDEAPGDHLAINLRAAISKARDYYNKLDNTPAYYAATILHPRYRNYCDVAWGDQPGWLELNNRNFQALWAQYRSLPKPRTHTRAKVNNIDDAINSLIDPNRAVDEEDEFDIWKRREPQVEAGSDSAKFPTKYWVGLQDRYPNLSKLALDVLSIPASSCECERVFSELGDLLEPRRRKISPELLAAIHCSRRWRKAGFGSSEIDEKEQLTVEQLISKYHVDTWDEG